MKKLKYYDYGIEIINDESNGDIVQFFSNKLDKIINVFVYICDSARYPKRVAKKVGEFLSNGDTYLNCNKFVFEKGKWIVYLNFKGNFYIYKDNLNDNK